MSVPEPKLTLGVEEEYLLVDRETRDLADDPPAEFMVECERQLGSRVTGEFLKAQVEIGTGICASIKDVRREVVELRQTIAHIANKFDMAPIAASTHPFATWRKQKHTQKERYDMLAQDLQAVVRRLLICGMHVHVGIEDADMRIDMMNQASYFLPHLLALSTSSPFWTGEKTGLMSYRLTVFDSLPRTGVPERFDSFGEYQRLVDQLIHAGMIEDGSKIWWDLRPSSNFPTLEMRMTDVCTRVEDSLTIAAFYQCIMSMLYRLRKLNQRWRTYPLLCVQENRWRAQRYGSTDTMIDFGIGEQVPYNELLTEISELCREDAERLDCVDEIANAQRIVTNGSSAQMQLAVYDEAIENGQDKDQALRAVVDWLIDTTVEGLG